jgi:hypothetical protein
MLKLLDVVALLVRRPDLGLAAGQVGTVVHCYDDAVEVEFAGDDGVTYAMAAFRASDLLKLRYEAGVTA